MTCNEVQDNLTAFIHGELDTSTTRAIHQHLSQCQTCLQEEVESRKANKLLSQFQFEALPEDFDEQLHRKLKSLELPAHKKRHDYKRIYYAVAATIVIMVGLQFFGSWLMTPKQQSFQLKNFPTSQAIFNSTEKVAETSLKDRFLQRYKQSHQLIKLKLGRE
jgi:anti-sigma factor RsiW